MRVAASPSRPPPPRLAPAMHLALLLLLAAVCLLQTARADFFQHFFQHGAQQEQEAPPAGDASWFHARVQAGECDEGGVGRRSEVCSSLQLLLPCAISRRTLTPLRAAQCGRYLCPDTLACVGRPSECPCPFPQQVRRDAPGTACCAAHPAPDPVSLSRRRCRRTDGAERRRQLLRAGGRLQRRRRPAQGALLQPRGPRAL